MNRKGKPPFDPQVFLSHSVKGVRLTTVRQPGQNSLHGHLSLWPKVKEIMRGAIDCSARTARFC
jgi:hypothetical protein